MQRRFRKQSRTGAWTLPLAGLLLAMLGFGLFELYQLIIPLRSANPLWKEVTVGESVIGDWMYEGQDQEGYLRFYNNGQTVLLPPDAHTFDADGKFVVIEKVDSSSLTFAYPYEAVPLRWWLIGFGVLVVPAVAVYLRIKRWSRSSALFGRRMARKAQSLRSKLPRPRRTWLPQKNTRFRPRRKPRLFR